MRLARRFGALLIAVMLAGAPMAAPRANAETYVYLTIDTTGDGSGTTQTADGYIDCRMVNGSVGQQEACNAQYPAGSNVIPATFTPAPGSCVAIGIGGECSPDGTALDLFFSTDYTVYVTYQRLVYSLTITKDGTGSGNVTGTPVPMNCGLVCSKLFYYGDIEHLVAVADSGSAFGGWTGLCAGQDATCDATVVATTQTGVIFNTATPPPVPTPSATPGQPTSHSPKPSAALTPTSTPVIPSSTSAGESTTAGDSPGPTGEAASGLPSPGGAVASPTPAGTASPDAAVVPILIGLLVVVALMGVAIVVLGLRLRRPPGAT